MESIAETDLDENGKTSDLVHVISDLNSVLDRLKASVSIIHQKNIISEICTFTFQVISVFKSVFPIENLECFKQEFSEVTSTLKDIVLTIQKTASRGKKPAPQVEFTFYQGLSKSRILFKLSSLKSTEYCLDYFASVLLWVSNTLALILSSKERNQWSVILRSGDDPNHGLPFLVNNFQVQECFNMLKCYKITDCVTQEIVSITEKYKDQYTINYGHIYDYVVAAFGNCSLYEGDFLGESSRRSYETVVKMIPEEVIEDGLCTSVRYFMENGAAYVANLVTQTVREEQRKVMQDVEAFFSECVIKFHKELIDLKQVLALITDLTGLIMSERFKSLCSEIKTLVNIGLDVLDERKKLKVLGEYFQNGVANFCEDISAENVVPFRNHHGVCEALRVLKEMQSIVKDSRKCNNNNLCYVLYAVYCSEVFSEEFGERRKLRSHYGDCLYRSESEIQFLFYGFEYSQKAGYENYILKVGPPGPQLYMRGLNLMFLTFCLKILQLDTLELLMLSKNSLAENVVQSNMAALRESFNENSALLEWMTFSSVRYAFDQSESLELKVSDVYRAILNLKQGVDILDTVNSFSGSNQILDVLNEYKNLDIDCATEEGTFSSENCMSEKLVPILIKCIQVWQEMEGSVKTKFLSEAERLFSTMTGLSFVYLNYILEMDVFWAVGEKDTADKYLKDVTTGHEYDLYIFEHVKWYRYRLLKSLSFDAQRLPQKISTSCDYSLLKIIQELVLIKPNDDMLVSMSKMSGAGISLLRLNVGTLSREQKQQLYLENVDIDWKTNFILLLIFRTRMFLLTLLYFKFSQATANVPSTRTRLSNKFVTDKTNFEVFGFISVMMPDAIVKLAVQNHLAASGITLNDQIWNVTKKIVNLKRNCTNLRTLFNMLHDKGFTTVLIDNTLLSEMHNYADCQNSRENCLKRINSVDAPLAGTIRELDHLGTVLSSEMPITQEYTCVTYFTAIIMLFAHEKFDLNIRHNFFNEIYGSISSSEHSFLRIYPRYVQNVLQIRNQMINVLVIKYTDMYLDFMNKLLRLFDICTRDLTGPLDLVGFISTNSVSDNCFLFVSEWCKIFPFLKDCDGLSFDDIFNECMKRLHDEFLFHTCENQFTRNRVKSVSRFIRVDFDKHSSATLDLNNSVLTVDKVKRVVLTAGLEDSNPELARLLAKHYQKPWDSYIVFRVWWSHAGTLFIKQFLQECQDKTYSTDTTYSYYLMTTVSKWIEKYPEKATVGYLFLQLKKWQCYDALIDILDHCENIQES